MTFYSAILRFSLTSTLMEYNINLPVAYLTPLNSIKLYLNIVTKRSFSYHLNITSVDTIYIFNVLQFKTFA